jgi:hypothetical protein
MLHFAWQEQTVQLIGLIGHWSKRKLPVANTYKQAQKAKFLNCTMLERLDRKKRCSLLGSL